MSSEKNIGIVLTTASTVDAKIQFLKDYESEASEGKMIQIRSAGKNILAVVESLEPHNDYFTKGDAWTESRRQGFKIPSNIARQFVVADVAVLGEIPNIRLINRPPFPGDPVLQVDLSDPKKIFGIDKDQVGYIWHGSLFGYKNAPIPLDVEQIPLHLGIFGTTGSGKSYGTAALFEKFTQIPAGQNKKVAIPMLIIDANADYVEYARQGQLGQCQSIVRYVFHGAGQDLRNEENVRTISISLDALSFDEVSELIMTFYSGGESSILQTRGLRTAIETVYNQHHNEAGFHTNQIFLDHDLEDELRGELARMERAREMIWSTRAAIDRALDSFEDALNEQQFIAENPELTAEFLDTLTRNHEMAIIDFSADGAPGISLQLKQMIVGYLATITFSSFTTFKSRGEPRYMVFAIEEAHNYIPNEQIYDIGASLAKSKLQLIATQGRKFGIGLCLISQSPRYLNEVVGSMLNSFFIHRISPSDITFVRRVTGGISKALENKLTKLARGQIIITGQMSRKIPIPLLLDIPEGSRTVEHRSGFTDVVGGLLGTLENQQA